MNEQILDVATVPTENPGTMIRHASDVAGVCREIVMRTACNIQGRKYVKCEGWMAIATAHGCVASSKDVQRIDGGYRAIGEIRRISDGVLLAQAEGFIGEDEPTWFGGGPRNLPKRADYAIRAMCQTRAISRACRAAFAHVVVLIDGGLSTTPAEEVPDGGFRDEPPKTPQDAPQTPTTRTPAATKKASPTPKSASAGKPAASSAPDAKFDAKAFLANCKKRLLALVGPDVEWAWWKYALDKSWILPNESLADTTSDKMFEGYDSKDIISSVAGLFDSHSAAVKAFAANCPPEFHDEILRGFVPMPRTGAAAPLAATPKNGNFCPACSSTATKTHADLIGARWCQKCGTQWQEDDPKKEPYEEHEWMFAKMPFSPKDQSKPYKGMTLGQIARLDNKYWFGIVMNFKAEPFNGRPPSAESVKFGEACEAARKHLEEEKEQADPSNKAMSEKDDDIPL